MRVVYMGTPDFAVLPLRSIVEAGHEVVLCVTQKDKPKGRGGKVLYTPVKEEALKHNIPVFQPDTMKDEDSIKTVRDANPDVIVVAAFGQILPKAVLDIPEYGCLNIHASLLPRLRGAAPIQQAVIDGDEETGITIMYMDEGLDTGDIILKKSIKIEADETGGSLFDKLALMGGPLICEVLDMSEKGLVTRSPQTGEASYAGMLHKKMGLIDFTWDAVRIERLIRGLNPWPSAYTHYNGKMLKIWDADVVHNISDIADSSKFNDIEQEIQCDANIAPATVCYVDKKRLIVKCGVDYLNLNEVQLEGKKRMKTDAFLLGCRVEAGTVFGAD